MTAFVLVSDSYTGGWVWRDVTARLREQGAEVHPATLTGMGDRRHLAGPGTDLETHIEDLVQLIDLVDEPELVIVGHGYGILPVLGAADRRPERIARIVYLDAGLPQDGDSALGLMADPAVRERLLSRAEQSGDGDDRRVPPAPLDEQESWGSTAGLTGAARERLAGLAAAQPLATLTQPLRLSGAVAQLPTSGILCIANGMGIAMVQALLAMGEPRIQRLADPRVGFFELDTGHWPMLSQPDELAGVLLRAAAGEGHRLVASGGERPGYLRPFLLDVPERPRERVGQVDLYLPDELSSDQAAPAVLLVPGGPLPAGLRPTPRDWTAFVGYGGYLAGLGVVGAVVDHRLHEITDYGRAAEDVAAAVELLRADPRVDPDRIALWFFSGGGLLSAEWLAAPPAWLRCVALTYAMLAPLPNWGFAGGRFSPAQAVAAAGTLPVVLTRVELERPEITATIDEFLTAAGEGKARVEVIEVPSAQHGFETLDHTEPARRAVECAVLSVLEQLRD